MPRQPNPASPRDCSNKPLADAASTQQVAPRCLYQQVADGSCTSTRLHQQVCTNGLPTDTAQAHICNPRFCTNKPLTGAASACTRLITSLTERKQVTDGLQPEFKRSASGGGVTVGPPSLVRRLTVRGQLARRAPQSLPLGGIFAEGPVTQLGGQNFR